MKVFLDHASTTPLRPVAKKAMMEGLEIAANPSSVHSLGQHTRNLLEDARDSIAASLDCNRSEVIFNSGGTESDNQAIKGLYWQRNKNASRKVVISSKTEHHAVLDTVEWLESHEGAEIIWIDVDSVGQLDYQQLESVIQSRHDQIAVISLMWANNETGVIHDIPRVCEMANQFGIPVHSDAIAAAGHMPISFKQSGLAAMTVSGHKLGAPIGVAVLIVGRSVKLESLVHGGGQERAMRSGTMNYPMAMSMAAALKQAVAELDWREKELGELRDYLETEVQKRIPEVEITVQGANRLPDNSHMIFPGCQGDSLLFLLDIAGVEVSTGSACQAGVIGPSHVLLGMGKTEEEANGCLRITLGYNSTKADVDKFLGAISPAFTGAKRAGLSAR
ncbi:MAG: cysteine desulfurase family protein [Microbacteriaceae bacterium]|nr:cysteine desulfurase family protein [Microbacteriaceae bacterium]MDR9443663.1 cysteine desulfurase family protein [Microbacteriaceae bacterium]